MLSGVGAEVYDEDEEDEGREQGGEVWRSPEGAENKLSPLLGSVAERRSDLYGSSLSLAELS